MQSATRKRWGITLIVIGVGLLLLGLLGWLNFNLAVDLQRRWLGGAPWDDTGMVAVISREFWVPFELIASVVLGLVGTAVGFFLITVPPRSGR